MSQHNATLQRSFLFADLAGYTAMTEQHGDEDAAATALRFAAMAADALVHGARIVKTIGDAVMIVADAPDVIVATAVALARTVHNEHPFPLARLGIHHGPCVERAGDYFGATVNLAARVCSHARAGQIIATQPVADAVRAMVGIRVDAMGEARFKNVSAPIAVFELAIVADGYEAEVTDPVCRMCVDPTRAAARLVHDGVTLFFCSERCAKTFLASPELHVPSRAR